MTTTCLSLEVPEAVHKDVMKKVWARIVELGGEDGDVPAPAAEATWHLSDEGRSNSSSRYEAMATFIEEHIKSGAWTLINCGTRALAGTILAQLTHVAGFRPRKEPMP